MEEVREKEGKGRASSRDWILISVTVLRRTSYVGPATRVGVFRVPVGEIRGGQRGRGRGLEP
jgi:hypothetical protein